MGRSARYQIESSKHVRQCPIDRDGAAMIESEVTPEPVVVGVDPGKTTGVCILRGDQVVHTEDVTDLRRLGALLKQWQPSLCVVETFVGANGARDFLSPCKVIGVVEYVCAILEIPIRWSSPSVLWARPPQMPVGSLHVRSAFTHAWNARRHVRG